MANRPVGYGLTSEVHRRVGILIGIGYTPTPTPIPRNTRSIGGWVSLQGLVKPPPHPRNNDVGVDQSGITDISPPGVDKRTGGDMTGMSVHHWTHHDRLPVCMSVRLSGQIFLYCLTSQSGTSNERLPLSTGINIPPARHIDH